MYNYSGNLSLTTNFTADNNPALKFDPYQKPANLDLARLHAKAKRVYIQDKNPDLEGLCPCCGLSSQNMELIPYCSSLREIYCFGPGYAMYFKFFQHCWRILFIMLCISGIYNLITNSSANQCDSPAVATAASYCVQSLYTTFAIVSKRNNFSQMNMQYLLNLVCICVLILYFQYVRVDMRKLAIEADENSITPSDYTVQISGLPTDPENPLSTIQGITSWLNAKSDYHCPVEVKKVVLSYDISDYLELKRKFEQKLRVMKPEEESERQNMRAEIDAMENSNNFRFVGTAFVSFKDAVQADYITKLLNYQ